MNLLGTLNEHTIRLSRDKYSPLTVLDDKVMLLRALWVSTIRALEVYLLLGYGDWRTAFQSFLVFVLLVVEGGLLSPSYIRAFRV